MIENSNNAQVAVDNQDNIIYFESLVNLLERLEIENEKIGYFFNHFGNIYCHLGLYQKAEPLYLKYLKISEKVLGEEHPSTATSYNNLAFFYYGQGDYNRAYNYMKRAVEVRSKVLPFNHSDLINSKVGLEILKKLIH